MKKQNDTTEPAISSNGVLPAVYLTEFDGRNETLVMWDRTRNVVYNGEKLQMNSYSCSTCKSDYKFEERKHKFCPFCGGEYKFKTDVSV